jgi:PAS domain-containing protein
MEITKYRSQLFAASEQAMVYLRQAQNTLTELGRTVADKPRRLQEALRARENDLRDLLVNSLDPIIVTDVGWRFVAANLQGLDLFGVSETNMRRFTIDIFLSQDQTPYIAGHGSSFIRREKRHGECKIRRLDGSLRVADYVLLAHFLPNWYVCRFCNIKTARVKSFATINSGNGNDSKLVRQCLESRGRKI